MSSNKTPQDPLKRKRKRKKTPQDEAAPEVDDLAKLQKKKEEENELFSESIIDRKLFDKVKDVTWFIKVGVTVNGEIGVKQGSGFSVSKEGLIMTCYHFFCPPGELLYIEARNHSESMFRRFNLVGKYPKFDVAILQVIGTIRCKAGQLASNGCLYPGQPLASVGYPGRHPGTFGDGRSCYRCVDVDCVSLLEDNQTCGSFKSSALSITPRYRMMGHTLDSNILSSPVATDFDKSLHPLAPVIISYGLAIPSGSSGSAVFKTDETIVGMAVRTDTSVHVSMLKACLEHFLSLVQIFHCLSNSATRRGRVRIEPVTLWINARPRFHWGSSHAHVLVVCSALSSTLSDPEGCFVESKVIWNFIVFVATSVFVSIIQCCCFAHALQPEIEVLSQIMFHFPQIMLHFSDIL